MKLVKTSTALLIALGFSAGTGAYAFECNWSAKQVHAQASTPMKDKQTEVAATPVDPVVLASKESVVKTEPTAEK